MKEQLFPGGGGGTRMTDSEGLEDVAALCESL